MQILIAFEIDLPVFVLIPVGGIPTDISPCTIVGATITLASGQPQVEVYRVRDAVGVVFNVPARRIFRQRQDAQFILDTIAP